MKPTAKRGLMGVRFENHNGTRSLISKDLKAKDKRKRWTPADKRSALNGD